MNAPNPILKDDPMPQPKPHEPSMEEILASIRRIIADDQALTASQGGPRPDSNGGAYEPSSRAGHMPVSNGPDSSVRAAFNMLLASRFVQHSDVIVGLTREMLRPLLKTWLDDNLPAIVERLVAAEIERVARGE